MDLLKTILLGVIQGLTEWLPISSTGHLRIAEYFMNEKVPLIFDFVLHTGTLIAVLLFFRKDIRSILSALAHRDFRTEDGRLLLLIIVGTIPAGIIGAASYKLVDSIFRDMLPLAIAFVVCGLVLYSTRFSQEKIGTIGYFAAILIGIGEGIAIIPGISRSGMTIATALLLGIKREKAFKFSFLLSIPAILGAQVLAAYTQLDELTAAGIGWTEVIAGTIATLVVGYFTLKLLWKILAKQKFHLFAFYCWIIGTVLILLSLHVF
jgi:undecaprenyl-diphosphatase